MRTRNKKLSLSELMEEAEKVKNELGVEWEINYKKSIYGDDYYSLQFRNSVHVTPLKWGGGFWVSSENRHRDGYGRPVPPFKIKTSNPSSVVKSYFKMYSEAIRDLRLKMMVESDELAYWRVLGVLDKDFDNGWVNKSSKDTFHTFSFKRDEKIRTNKGKRLTSPKTLRFKDGFVVSGKKYRVLNSTLIGADSF